MKNSFLYSFVWALLALSCKEDDVDPNRKPDDTYNPQIIATNFSESKKLSNPYFSFQKDKIYVFESKTADGLERREIKLLPEAKMIMGISCAIINDKVWLNGVIIEDTDDWYAQDNQGNVWYFGEDVDNFDAKGKFKDKGGSWEAGIDGAKPGLIMPASPKVGLRYRQEYYFNKAEDEGEILETGIAVTIPLGTYNNCIKTRDFTALEPDLNEYKFYAPGIGLIKEVNATDKEELYLTEIK